MTTQDERDLAKMDAEIARLDRAAYEGGWRDAMERARLAAASDCWCGLGEECPHAVAAIRALKPPEAEATARAESPGARAGEKRPPPPDVLGDALQDRIHPTSGRLLGAKPIGRAASIDIAPEGTDNAMPRATAERAAGERCDACGDGPPEIVNGRVERCPACGSRKERP